MLKITVDTVDIVSDKHFEIRELFSGYPMLFFGTSYKYAHTFLIWAHFVSFNLPDEYKFYRKNLFSAM
ncbi:hypothetical protein ES705_31559 [subsurface metagenome]